MALAVGQRMHVDHRLLVLERHIGKAPAIGRPGRRQDRLEGRERGFRVGAVGVGDLQLKAVAALDYVGDARREHALLAGQLLVDEIRNAVRGGACLLGRHGVGDAGKIRALDGVEQLEADFEAAVGARRDRAQHQRVGLARAPLGVVDVRCLGKRRVGRGHLDAAQQAAALQVGAHDRADGLRQRALAGERRDGDRDARSARAGDFDGELRGGGGGDREQECREQFSHRRDYMGYLSLGWKLIRNSLVKSSGLSGRGNGDALRIARSTSSS